MGAGRGSFAAAVALVSALASGPGCGAPPEVARPEVRHASLDAFAAEGASAPSGGEAPRRRVVLIGIDGASWDYLEPLFDAGELPALARLAREGSTARLRSVECHFTPPAWTTMFTGVLPHRHGIYSFGSWDGEMREFSKVTSNEVVAPTVWDVASRSGRRVSVVGVPVTYPAHPVEGVLVSGLMTPKTRLPPLQLVSAPERRRPVDPDLAGFSPVLAAALEDEAEQNVLLATFVDTRDDGEVDHDEVRLTVLRRGFGPPARRLLGEHRFPVDRFSPWVHVRLPPDAPERDGWIKIRFDVRESGGVGYVLTPTFLPLRRPFTHPPSLASELTRRFGYYLPHEFLSKEILPSLAEEAADHARYFLERPGWDLHLQVFGQSDNAHHLIGFGGEALSVYRSIDELVGEVMDAADPDTTLIVASDHGFRAFDHGVDLNQVLAGLGLLRWKAAREIDHEHTLVFHNMWHLHFNRSLLSKEALRERGIEVEEGEPPDAALSTHLTRVLRDVRGPDGRRFPVEVVRLPEGAVGNAPDMAVLAPEDFWLEFWNVDQPHDRAVRPLKGDARWKHGRDGIFAAWGKEVRRGHDLGTLGVQDVAPTLLDLLGLPVADDLDGRVIPLLAREVAAKRALHRVASFGALRREKIQAPEDPATFEETLRALGYVRD